MQIRGGGYQHLADQQQDMHVDQEEGKLQTAYEKDVHCTVQIRWLEVSGEEHVYKEGGTMQIADQEKDIFLHCRWRKVS